MASWGERAGVGGFGWVASGIGAGSGSTGACSRWSLRYFSISAWER